MNNRGYALLEGLIAGGIAAATLVAVASALSASGRGVANVESHAGVTNLKDTVNLIVDDPTVCATALWDNEVEDNQPSPKIAYFNPDGDLPADHLLTTLKLGPSAVLGLGARSGWLTTKTLTLSEIDPTLRQSCDGKTTYFAGLTVVSERANDASHGTTAASFPFYVTTYDSTHQIAACGRDRTICPAPAQSHGPNLVFSTSPTGSPVVTSFEFPKGPWMPFDELYVVNIGDAPSYDNYSAFPSGQVIRANAKCEAYIGRWDPGVACTIQYQSDVAYTQYLGFQFRPSPNAPLNYNWIKLTAK